MIGVIVVGHGNIASDMVSVAEQILHGKQKYFEAINVKVGESEEVIKNNLDRIMKMPEIEGVLVLSDIHGSFSSACAYIGKNSDTMAVVTGVNLNMVLKVLNHREDMNLEELIDLACKGGKEGIIDVCHQKDKKNKG